MVLARPEGAIAGSRGLALFVMPLRLENGRRNHYRFVRLKDKLGTRSMATAEIVLEGAIAYLVGRQDQGLKQILDQVNLSRLSHGVRAAALMRRCLNESLQVAKKRVAFDMPLIYLPLMRRQLLKLMLPTEQALSVYLYTASVMDAVKQGDAAATRVLRLLTPLLKFRSTRDNIQVATGAMEVRGGNGFIEDWVNARLVRDAHTGVLWEGTSNIIALDVLTRAIRKDSAHQALASALRRLLHEAAGVPAGFLGRLNGELDRAMAFADRVAADPAWQHLSRRVASALYHIMSAVLLTWEAARIGTAGGDARRLLLTRLVLDHRLSAHDPMALPDVAREEAVIDLLLQDDAVSLRQAAGIVWEA
jgi:alkylation response protein AidB-like acyl-CoA dehydrogenase